MIKYSDLQIAELINEPKPLTLDWYSKIQTKTHMKYETKSFDAKGIKNNKFCVIWRQSFINQLDFSAIFGVIPNNATKPFRLKRYDGEFSPHSNPIEKEQFHDFHIHTATERYQVFGTREEDKYAQVTDRFSDLTGALKCLLEDCNFQLPETSQLSLL